MKKEIDIRLIPIEDFIEYSKNILPGWYLCRGISTGPMKYETYNQFRLSINEEAKLKGVKKYFTIDYSNQTITHISLVPIIL